MKKVLTIAGSDSTGGAGIQGDMRAILGAGGHPLTVITAVTAQSTTEITSIASVDNVADQLATIARDIEIDSVKIGMLKTVDNIRCVINFLKSKPHLPVVLDPLIYSSSGTRLLDEEAGQLLGEQLIPLVTLVTPNKSEAEYLAGCHIEDLDSVRKALKYIYNKYGANVLLKGGHLEVNAGQATDYFYDGIEIREYRLNRLIDTCAHGTGCCLSSSIATGLSQGMSLAKSIEFGKTMVARAIANAYKVGKGDDLVDPLIHFITNTVTMNDVANTCLATGGRPIMAEAAEEMKAVTDLHQGLVINLGTLNKDKIETMKQALRFIDEKRQKVLLDPVGCGASPYRLETAKALLETGKIAILKLNAREGMALLDGHTYPGFGVDSDEIDLDIKLQVAKKLSDMYGKGKLIVAITGQIDLVVRADERQILEGGTSMQSRISGSGCMLNAVIMTFVSKSHNTYGAVVQAMKHMNKASERATIRLKNKSYSMSYKHMLIDELSVIHKAIYLITDESLDFESVILTRTEQALAKGVKILQYRAKNKKKSEKFYQAKKLRQLTIKYGTSFIINDDIELAKSIKADGVHLGVMDASIEEARRVLGDTSIIGATAKTLDQAIEAERQGADYLGVGALYPSPTKPEAILVTMGELKRIYSQVDLPIYGIGGIRLDNLTQDIIDHVDGIAVVSAVYSGNDHELQGLMSLLIN